MPKKIVITGASGFVGRQIVPRLAATGTELLLVGRSRDQLSALFPRIRNCSYASLAEEGKGFDLLLHLAVLNNNVSTNQSDFHDVNVGLLKSTLESAKRAGIPKFLNTTTFHAIDNEETPYAKSKRAALDVLAGESGISITHVFLPAVYGDDFAGRLGVIKKVPPLLRPAALRVLTALLPTVHVDKLVLFLTEGLNTAPQSVFLANDQDRNPVYRLGKRLIDLSFAVTVLVLVGWLLLIIWAWIKLDSPGPGIFAQQRVGKACRPFTCFKFRTMKLGTRQAGTHELTADAITGIGAFLRRTKLDELPQVINILRGEISLVGPRPGLPVQKNLIAAREAQGVFTVLPGITGLAQIRGVDMSDPKLLAQIDARYVRQRGLLLDVKIILATFLGKGRGDRVRS